MWGAEHMGGVLQAWEGFLEELFLEVSTEVWQSQSRGETVNSPSQGSSLREAGGVVRDQSAHGTGQVALLGPLRNSKRQGRKRLAEEAKAEVTGRRSHRPAWASTVFILCFTSSLATPSTLGVK